MAQENTKLTSQSDPMAMIAQILAELKTANANNPLATPEGLQTFIEGIKKPYVDPVLQARLKRDRDENLAQLERQRTALAKQQADCSHKDRMGGWLIYPVHNFVDGDVRGLCVICRLLIERGNDPYNLFKTVLEREQFLYSDAPAVSGYM